MYFLIYCKYNYDHKWQLFTTLLSLQQLSCWTCFHTAVACENDQYLLQRFSHAAFKTHECHMTKTFTYYLLIPIASNGSGRDFLCTHQSGVTIPLSNIGTVSVLCITFWPLHLLCVPVIPALSCCSPRSDWGNDVDWSLRLIDNIHSC